MGSTPLGGCIGFFLKNLFSNICFHIKDSKWGRKCIFMNCTSRNGSPQQIPLWQFPFAYEAKPHYRCRAFWAVTDSKLFLEGFILILDLRRHIRQLKYSVFYIEGSLLLHNYRGPSHSVDCNQGSCNLLKVWIFSIPSSFIRGSRDYLDVSLLGIFCTSVPIRNFKKW